MANKSCIHISRICKFRKFNKSEGQWEEKGGRRKKKKKRVERERRNYKNKGERWMDEAESRKRLQKAQVRMKKGDTRMEKEE